MRSSGGGDGVVTLIETRGEGGLIICAPTEGYAVTRGDLCDPPVLTEEERDNLLRAAWELNEYVPPVVDGPGWVTSNTPTWPSTSTMPSYCRPGKSWASSKSTHIHSWTRCGTSVITVLMFRNTR